MKKAILFSFLIFCLNTFTLAQNGQSIPIVEAVPNEYSISLSYHLEPIPAHQYYEVLLSLDLDGQVITPKSFSHNSDIGKQVKAGKNRRLVWQVNKDFPSLSGQNWEFTITALVHETGCEIRATQAYVSKSKASIVGKKIIIDYHLKPLSSQKYYYKTDINANINGKNIYPYAIDENSHIGQDVKAGKDNRITWHVSKDSQPIEESCLINLQVKKHKKFNKAFIPLIVGGAGITVLMATLVLNKNDDGLKQATNSPLLKNNFNNTYIPISKPNKNKLQTTLKWTGSVLTTAGFTWATQQLIKRKRQQKKHKKSNKNPHLQAYPIYLPANADHKNTLGLGVNWNL